MTNTGDLPLASKKQDYIDGLGNAHEWTNSDTCVRGNLMVLDIGEVGGDGTGGAGGTGGSLTFEVVAEGLVLSSSSVELTSGQIETSTPNNSFTSFDVFARLTKVSGSVLYAVVHDASTPSFYTPLTDAITISLCTASGALYNKTGHVWLKGG